MTLKLKHLTWLVLLLAAGNLQAQNMNISNGIWFDGEPFLAVDPANPSHLVAAWMGYVPFQQITIKTRVSLDGGRTWSQGTALPHASPSFTSADPSIAFSAQGVVYLTYVDYRKSPDSGAVYSVMSADGGLSWGQRSKVIDLYDDAGKKPIDRPWVCIDNSTGPFGGRIYLTTKPAPWIPPPNRPYFIRSLDAGLNWQPWRYLDTLNWLTGPWIAGPMAACATGSDGIFHAVYPSWVVSQSVLPQFILASSSDGGASFQYQPVIQGAAGVSDTLSKKGYTLACDPSDPQHMAFFFISSLFGDPDVIMTETYDGGSNWTTPLRINDDQQGNGRMQDLAWASFDTDGDLAAAWRDRRHAPDTGYAGNPYEIYATVRWHDSAAFQPNFRISDTIVDFDSILMSKGNDFMTARMARDTLIAVWGDTRSGSLNIWFQRTALHNPGPSFVNPLASEPIPRITCAPNPVKGVLRIEGIGLETIRIYSSNGKMVKTLSRGPCPAGSSCSLTADFSQLPPGEYILEALTQRGNLSCKIAHP